MKKSGYFIVFLTVMLLTGCSKKEQMTNFIPTQIPEEEVESGEEAQSGEGAQAGEEATQTPETVHVGETTTMYVKLDKYGGSLNVRSTPSTSGEAIGFLVHAEEVEVIEIVDDWASILYKDTICYVNSKYLVDTQPDYLEPPTEAPKPTKAPTPTPSTTTPGTTTDAPPEI